VEQNLSTIVYQQPDIDVDGNAIFTDRDVRIFEDPKPVNYELGALGWYIDYDDASSDGLRDPQFPGEKAIRNIQIRGGVAFVNSVIPKTVTSCTVIAGGAALAFCPDSGTIGVAGTTLQGLGLTTCQGASVFDVDGDGEITSADLAGGQVIASTFFEDSVPTDSSFIGNERVTQQSDSTLDFTTTNTFSGKHTGRISWTRLSGN
jgi:Tfp pilus tip-associated adhesin PilY1